MTEFHAALSILNLQYLPTNLKATFVEFIRQAALTQYYEVGISSIRDFFEAQSMNWPIDLDEKIQIRTQELNLNLTKHAVKYCGFMDPHFPKQLLAQVDPCLFLSYFGNEAWLEMDFLAVVGSRDIQRETLNWMNIELFDFLKHSQFGIVSGGALGADQAAHQVSLSAGRPTLAFLPCGLGHIYPKQFQHMQQEVIIKGGAVLSEYPFSLPMHKGMFAHRNRLIAVLGIATLIVQASQRSGTLMTARLCAENGRSVFVVPGHPMNSHFLGSLQLIQEGASILLGASDLSEFLIAEKSFGLRMI